MNTEVIVAILSILTLLENLIFLIITKVKDEKKSLANKRNLQALKLCEQWDTFYELEKLYIKEISRLKTACNENSSTDIAIKR